MGYHSISGQSGAGKSTVGAEIALQGYEVIEADEVFGYLGDLETEGRLPPTETITDEDWYSLNGWLWDEDRVQRQLAAPTSRPVFVEGGAHNEARFFPLFSSLTYLTAPIDMLEDRLRSRLRYADGDPTGSQFYFNRMRRWHGVKLERAKQYGALILNTYLLEPPSAAAMIIEHALNHDTIPPKIP